MNATKEKDRGSYKKCSRCRVTVGAQRAPTLGLHLCQSRRRRTKPQRKAAVPLAPLSHVPYPANVANTTSFLAASLEAPAAHRLAQERLVHVCAHQGGQRQ